ncbi:MAG: YecA family protein [Pseudomonadota bacterium]
MSVKVSSLPRRYRNAHIGGPDSGQLTPPDVRTFATAPFGDQQRARLTAWLREAGWPRGQMDIVELEGFLVALIAWPVAIAAGAWLPLIWGIRGWKVPNKISTRPQFEEFIALIIGFLQELDRDLTDQPSRFKSSVLRSPSGPGQAERLHRWGRGFMTAVTLGSQGLKGRSESAVASVRLIAGKTSASAISSPRAAEEIVSAVMALVEQRASRGPLGPLEVVAKTA